MVSVIIPVFNTEKFIIPCLNSLEDQTYKDFEVILVDDGSTDNSVRLINEYLSQTKIRMKLIRQDNQGVSTARNIGIAHSIGDLVCFLDSDDMYALNFLELMTSELVATNCDMVVCGFQPISENIINSFSINDQRSVMPLSSYEAMKSFLFSEFRSGIWTIMTKKEIITRNSIIFQNSYKYSEDLDFLWRLFSVSISVSLLSSKLYLYRIRIGSAMSFFDEKRLDGYKLFNKLENHFKTHRPDFAPLFLKYGVSKWVWSTLWQAAISEKKYSRFIKYYSVLEVKKHIRKLFDYPKLYVAISSRLIIYTPFLFFIFIRVFGVVMQIRSIASSGKG